jgi:putative endonuclease
MLSVLGFTKKYRCTKLIYYEVHDTQDSAFTREQELKKWSRLKKDALIDTKNPERRDLFKELIDLAGE